MQAYMKSSMPYHGVPTPVADKVFKSVFAPLEFADSESWRQAILYLWRNARFREERRRSLKCSALYQGACVDEYLQCFHFAAEIGLRRIAAAA